MNAMEKIFDLMKRKGYDDEDLAMALGVKKGEISRWRTGKSYSYYDVIDRIAWFFNVSPEYFLEENKVDEFRASTKYEALIEKIKYLSEKDLDALGAVVDRMLKK